MTGTKALADRANGGEFVFANTLRSYLLLLQSSNCMQANIGFMCACRKEALMDSCCYTWKERRSCSLLIAFTTANCTVSPENSENQVKSNVGQTKNVPEPNQRSKDIDEWMAAAAAPLL